MILILFIFSGGRRCIFLRASPYIGAGVSDCIKNGVPSSDGDIVVLEVLNALLCLEVLVALQCTHTMGGSRSGKVTACSDRSPLARWVVALRCVWGIRNLVGRKMQTWCFEEMRQQIGWEPSNCWAGEISSTRQ